MEKDRERPRVSDQPPSTPPVEIPVRLLSAETIRALVESFVLREGTDYGSQEVAHDTKISQVLKQLEGDKIKIIFDPDTESATLMREEDWEKLTK